MYLRTSFSRHGIPRNTRRLFTTRLFTTRSSQLYPSKPPIIEIENGTFYRQHPSGTNPSSPLFKDVNFTLHSFPSPQQHWAVLGPHATTFLQILRGEHICLPPTARRFPYLNSTEIEEKDITLRLPSRAIQYVGFGSDQGGLGGQGTAGAYLSARYESRREATDFSVEDYLIGNTELNALDEKTAPDDGILSKIILDMDLQDLVRSKMPVSNLSNGQTRRAKIARALVSGPEVLLLDEPFMGLDPPSVVKLSRLLEALAKANSPRLIITLRPQDPVPEWITHLLVPGVDHTIALPKEHFLNSSRGRRLDSGRKISASSVTEGPPTELSRDGFPMKGDPTIPKRNNGEPLVEMEGVRVAYGNKTVLGNWEDPDSKRPGLWWTVRRGERWGIFGPNGSGKTTVLSLICSDHPQTYSLPIKLFGRSRLPAPGQPGISIFDIQARIGHSSPEIHNYFPRKLTVRQILENAWSETFMGSPVLDEDASARVDSCLRWFEAELRPNSTLTANTEQDAETQSSTIWAEDTLFRELPFSGQRVALFIRAIIKNPDLVILDEAFSGMNEAVRDKCMLFLAHGESKTIILHNENGESKNVVIDWNIGKANKKRVQGLQDHQALICISHLPEEVPGSVRDWIRLPDANTGRPARMGRLSGPLEVDGYAAWDEIWGVRDMDATG